MSILLAATLLATPAVGVQYGPMVARFIGDLSDETTLGHSVQIKTLYIDAETLPIRAYFAFDIMWTATEHRGDRFLYPAGAELDVLGFLWRPNLCWHPDLPIEICGGIGQGTVNVNAEKDRRDWGTWNYQLQLDVALADHITVFAQGKYVGEVEQEIDGVPAAFTVLMAGGGVSAHW